MPESEKNPVDLWGHFSETIKDHEKASALIGHVFIVIIVLWLRFALAPLISGYGATTTGPYGDSFGALSSLFSGLALLGVAYAVVMQREELDIARREAHSSEQERRKTEKIMTRQAEALMVAAKLNAANSIAQGIIAEARAATKDYDQFKEKFDKSLSCLHCMNILLEIMGSVDSQFGFREDGTSAARDYVGRLAHETRMAVEEDGDRRKPLALRHLKEFRTQLHGITEMPSKLNPKDKEFVDAVIERMKQDSYRNPDPQSRNFREVLEVLASIEAGTFLP